MAGPCNCLMPAAGNGSGKMLWILSVGDGKALPYLVAALVGLQDGHQCPHVLYIECVKGQVQVPLRGARHGNGIGDDCTVHAVSREGGRCCDDIVRNMTLERREEGRGEKGSRREREE